MSQEDYIIMKQLLNDVNQPVISYPVIEQFRQAIVSNDTSNVRKYARKCLDEGFLVDGFVKKLLEKHKLTQAI